MLSYMQPRSIPSIFFPKRFRLRSFTKQRDTRIFTQSEAGPDLQLDIPCSTARFHSQLIVGLQEG